MDDGLIITLAGAAVFSVVGAFLAFWPETARRFDESMRPFFDTAETHEAFLRGCGYILLCVGCACLLAAFVYVLKSHGLES